MSKAKIQSVIENAISKADSSYFFEDYTKQARAVMAALESAGFTVIANDLPEAMWKQIADEMRTGRVKPEEHVKDVFQVALRVASEAGNFCAPDGTRIARWMQQLGG